MDWAAHIGRVIYTLGESVSVVGTTTAAITAMYLAPSQRLTLGLDGGINTSSPNVVAITADLPASPTAVITSRGTHNIKDIRPDDPGGFTVLELFEA